MEFLKFAWGPLSFAVGTVVAIGLTFSLMGTGLFPGGLTPIHDHSTLQLGGTTLNPNTLTVANAGYFNPGITGFIFDEFLGGTFVSTDVKGIGNLNWNIRAGSVGTISNAGSLQNHPGILVLQTGAVAGNAMTAELDPLVHQSDAVDSTFIVRTITVDGTTSFGVGFSDFVSNTARFVKNFADTNWQASINGINTDTGVAVANNGWYKMRIQYSPSQVVMTINNNAPQTFTTGLPAGGMSPHVAVTTNTTAIRSLYFDTLYLQFSSLVR